MRRILAMILDIMIVLMYAGLLFVFNQLFLSSSINFNELTANIIGIIAMILPAGIYFALMEKRFGYTFGKKVFALKVVSMSDESLSKTSAIIRTVIFVLPWIVGHLFVYRGFYSDWTDTLGLTILGVMTYGFLLINYGLMIFRKDHRGIHELLSQSKTVS